MKKPLVLLVEDERETAQTLSEFLFLKGMDVFVAFDGLSAIRWVDSNAATVSAAILDVMVPEADGYEICRHIKTHPVAKDVPVLFLTAKDREEDEISGIRLGADSYLAKPAGLSLILTYLESLLRRFPRESTDFVRAGTVWLNAAKREVWLEGKRLDVTPTEFELLQLFVTHPKRVFDRAELLDSVFGAEKNVFDRTVDVHIKNLRLKLGSQGDLIRTVRGIGYGFDESFAGSAGR